MTAKESLAQFFWNSLTEDAHASMKLLSLDKSLSYGRVAAELAECPHFSDEVQSNLALIWKAGEAWIRFWLAGKIQLGKLDEAEDAIAEQVATLQTWLQRCKSGCKLLPSETVELSCFVFVYEPKLI